MYTNYVQPSNAPGPRNRGLEEAVLLQKSLIQKEEVLFGIPQSKL
jgi:hypothetical protein